MLRQDHKVLKTVLNHKKSSFKCYSGCNLSLLMLFVMIPCAQLTVIPISTRSPEYNREWFCANGYNHEWTYNESSSLLIF